MEPAAALPEIVAEPLAPSPTLDHGAAGAPDAHALRGMAQAFLRAGCRLLVRSRIDLTVEGQEHLPASGPVVLASRHFHHQWDAAIFLAVLPRAPHFVVALDWVRFRWHRALLERCCRLLSWPVILRPDGPRMRGPSVYRGSDVPAYMRRAVRRSVGVLGSGECLVVFPEAFPNIDSVPTPKRVDDDFLPFRAGFLRIAARAERDAGVRVPIVPVGFEYRRGRRWDAVVRFGAPIFLHEIGGSSECATAILENHVRMLSALPAVTTK